jgi:hypothetical protein
MAVEAEAPPDDAVEAADEEIGEEVRPRLVLCAENVVAVCAGEATVAAKVGAAVRVRDDDVLAGGCLVHGGADPLRPVVQLRRDGSDLQIPAAAGGDLLDVQRQRAARNYDATAVTAVDTTGTWYRTCLIRTRSLCTDRAR